MIAFSLLINEEHYLTVKYKNMVLKGAIKGHCYNIYFFYFEHGEYGIFNEFLI